jgi:hypothetical protein
MSIKSVSACLILSQGFRKRHKNQVVALLQGFDGWRVSLLTIRLSKTVCKRKHKRLFVIASSFMQQKRFGITLV